MGGLDINRISKTVEPIVAKTMRDSDVDRRALKGNGDTKMATPKSKDLQYIGNQLEKQQDKVAEKSKTSPQPLRQDEVALAQQSEVAKQNEVMKQNVSAQFGFNKEINRFTITFVDKSSNEVVKEVPSEATQQMLQRLKQTTGAVYDEQL